MMNLEMVPGLQHGKTNATKKAIVQLAEGETIDLYANI